MERRPAPRGGGRRDWLRAQVVVAVVVLVALVVMATAPAENCAPPVCDGDSCGTSCAPGWTHVRFLIGLGLLAVAAIAEVVLLRRRPNRWDRFSAERADDADDRVDDGA